MNWAKSGGCVRVGVCVMNRTIGGFGMVWVCLVRLVFFLGGGGSDWVVACKWFSDVEIFIQKEPHSESGITSMFGHGYPM